YREDRWIDFPGRIQTAEYEGGLLWQPAHGTGRCGFGTWTRRVIGHEGLRQEHELLVVELLGSVGDDAAVTDQVVDRIRAHARRIAEVAHLHASRAMLHDPGPGVARIPAQVDEDVDAAIGDDLRSPLVADLADIDEVIECTLDPAPRLASIIPS